MNKYEEAILRVALDFRDRVKSDNILLVGQMDIDLLNELVDRATPKKPVDIIYNTHGGVMFGKCPVCGRLVVAYNACPTNECRQAIDWTNESEQIAKGDTK